MNSKPLSTKLAWIVAEANMRLAEQDKDRLFVIRYDDGYHMAASGKVLAVVAKEREAIFWIDGFMAAAVDRKVQ